MSTEAPFAESKVKAIHGIALCQFFLGVLIVALNVLVLGATFINRKLRAGSFYFLSSNLWFANLLLGGIVAVSNVLDRPDVIALEKVEGTVAVMNCLATLATLLALSTARVVSVKTPERRMANRTVLKVLIFTWTGVFALILVKTIVFSLGNMGYNACYTCLLGFEAALLVIFGSAAVILYILAMYSVCVHQKSAVHDSGVAVPTNHSNFVKEYQDTITVGIWLGSFTIPFFMLVILFAVYVIDDSTVDHVAAEVILTLFYTHCVINPLVLIFRDDEVRSTARKLICCQRFINDPAGQEQPIVQATPAPPAYSTLPPNPQQQQQQTEYNAYQSVPGQHRPTLASAPPRANGALTPLSENNNLDPGETFTVSDPRGADVSSTPIPQRKTPEDESFRQLPESDNVPIA